MYTTLLLSPNYVTKRQSLKLLGEILLDRTNFNVMTRYISSEENLKMMMNLLRDKSKNIQFEAFHVFKVSSHSQSFASSEVSVESVFGLVWLLVTKAMVSSFSLVSVTPGLRCQSKETSSH